jgi:hypothetical protein
MVAMGSRRRIVYAKRVSRLLLLPGTVKQKTKKQNARRAMGLKTVKTFLSSVYSPTKARQWRQSTASSRGGTAGG